MKRSWDTYFLFLAVKSRMKRKISVSLPFILFFACYTILIQDFDGINVAWSFYATIQCSFLLKMRRMKQFFAFVSPNFPHFFFHATLQQNFCVNSGSMKGSYDISFHFPSKD